METGEVIETAFIAYLLYIDLVFDQQFAGMTYSYFVDELRIGFSCPGFKVPAEIVDTDVCNIRYFLGLYLTFEIGQGEFIDRMDPVVFGLFEIMLKAY